MLGLKGFDNFSNVIEQFKDKIDIIESFTRVVDSGWIEYKKEFYKNLFLYPDLVSQAFMGMTQKDRIPKIADFIDNISKIKDKKEFEYLLGINKIDFSATIKDKLNQYRKKQQTRQTKRPNNKLCM